jgi:serine/threonine-protein kinase
MAEILHERFELIKKVGSGGTGEVYKALDLRLKRLVAIKRVLSSKRGRASLLGRLLKEAENLARVEHPNVVMVHDILETPDSVSIVMELVKGTPFVKLFRSRGIPEAEFVGYFRQLVAALEAVHAVGMIHRDVNPRNVLVSQEGVVKLTDFGLSGFVNDDDLRLGGTLGYMAPETMRKGTELSFGIDIYSLGFLAYQAILGIRQFKKLYGARKPRDWVRWVLSRERFKTLRELDAPVSTGFSEIVAKMLEKDPHQRYRKIKHVRKDCELLARRAAGRVLRLGHAVGGARTPE